jgi:hypothetical protein
MRCGESTSASNVGTAKGPVPIMMIDKRSLNEGPFIFVTCDLLDAGSRAFHRIALA